MGMPTKGKIEIAPGVEYNVLAREWRCKWSEENNRQSLKEAQRLLLKYQGELAPIVHDYFGLQIGTHEILNQKVDFAKCLIERIVSGDECDFKVVIKLPVDKFFQWEVKNFEPEERFLKELAAIEGISNLEALTYSLEVVPLVGPIRIPKASQGCM